MIRGTAWRVMRSPSSGKRKERIPTGGTPSTGVVTACLSLVALLAGISHSGRQLVSGHSLLVSGTPLWETLLPPEMPHQKALC